MIDKLSWITVYPEIILLTMACVISLVDLRVTDARRQLTYVLTLISLGVVAVVQAMYANSGGEAHGFGQQLFGHLHGP